MRNDSAADTTKIKAMRRSVANQMASPAKTSAMPLPTAHIDQARHALALETHLAKQRRRRHVARAAERQQRKGQRNQKAEQHGEQQARSGKCPVSAGIGMKDCSAALAPNGISTLMTRPIAMPIEAMASTWIR